MNSTFTVMIQDHVFNKEIFFAFTEEDVEDVLQSWHTKAPVLANHVAKHESDFKDVKGWDTLQPMQWQYLIQTSYDSFSQTWSVDGDDVQWLQFLLISYCHCLSINTATSCNFLKLTRISNEKMLFDLSLSSVLEMAEEDVIIKPIPTKKREKFKVVVDNDKNDKRDPEKV